MEIGKGRLALDKLQMHQPAFDCRRDVAEGFQGSVYTCLRPDYLTRLTQYLRRRDAAPPEFERQLETRGAPLVSSEQFAVRTKPYEAEHVVPKFLVDQQEVGSEVAVTAAGPVAG